ncbi:MAG: nicotinate-nucleotide--dimethylbenzimidazole phosphoribosyltransferase [Deferrisomatales bacterium]
MEGSSTQSVKGADGRLAGALARIRPPRPEGEARARERAENLAIPAGSLGRVVELAVRLAGIQGTLRPAFPRKAVAVMAGDHGVVRQGVSAFPPEVTPQMVANFTRGQASINALARAAGARVVVVDAGVAADLASVPGLRATRDLGEALSRGWALDRKVRPGTGDISEGPALSREEAVAALEVGIEVVEGLCAEGLDLVATGDMGIGNTTPSSALACVFTGKAPEEVTGRGTGIDEAALANKRRVVARALEVNRPDPADPVGALAGVGGAEIGALAGVVLGAAAAGIPVLVDGFISTAGALVACALAPHARPYVIAAHRSQEPGHRIMLEHLGLDPLLDLDLRLGEGTGAALAMPLVDGAAAVLREVATFAEAGVSEGQDRPRGTTP